MGSADAGTSGRSASVLYRFILEAFQCGMNIYSHVLPSCLPSFCQHESDVSDVSILACEEEISEGLHAIVEGQKH